MTEEITSSKLFNSFAVFRELLTGISALSTLNPRWAEDKHYYEDLPNTKAINFKGFPFINIDTEMNDEIKSLDGMKQMFYSTTINIYTDYFVEKEIVKLNSYLQAVAYYLNANRETLRNTYDIFNLQITKSRERDSIDQKELVVGSLTLTYTVMLNVNS